MISVLNPASAPPPSGCLYVVAVPIGHPRDITLRALDVLRAVDLVVCEERREGATLLKALGIEKELVELNEHTEASLPPLLAQEAQAGKTLALISDCGTPVFSDPGHSLIRVLTQAGIPIIPVPGASSLMAALSVCDFKVERFIYEGFLPRDKDERRARLNALRSERTAIVLMDTPYRLAQTLEEIGVVFGPTRRILLACDLTLPTEAIFRGPVAQVREQAGATKREFVLIIPPAAITKPLAKSQTAERRRH